MGDFAIEVRRQDGAGVDEPAEISISADELVFTQLIRSGANAPDDHVQAPPAQFAFWLVDNWWRLIAECVPSSGQTADWRLAHDLASMGGYAWPRLAIWGEGDRVGLSSRSDPPGVVGPVRYLTDALVYVSTEEFTRPALAFVESIADGRAGFASDWAALRAQLDGLNGERHDPDLAGWRTLEAQLGYDVDEAPEVLLQGFSRLQKEFGREALGEAALAVQGPKALDVLEGEIVAANDQHWQCDLARTASKVGILSRQRSEAPWEFGERAATAVRNALSLPKGSLSNGILGDVLSVKSAAFRSVEWTRTAGRAYGLRLNTGRKRGEVVSLAAAWAADRRFEFARALGDAIWSQGGNLGLLTRAKSERQKFQRAFAQSLLCPYDDLLRYIGKDRSDGALSAAARHFLVSERVIRSLLVNKRNLERRRLDSRPQSAIDMCHPQLSFEEAVEAA